MEVIESEGEREMEAVGQIQVGLLGFGTVGTGVLRLLEEHQDDLFHQTGCTINVKKILVQQLDKPRPLHVHDTTLTTNPEEVLFDPEIDIIIEVIGGIDKAREYISQALEQKKHVITANKDVMAVHGPELLTLASHNGSDLFYEASVAGGIPIVRALVEGFSSDRITKMVGILNGTTNYMLTQMSTEGLAYEESLQQAQSLGYAEMDPTADVEGLDAARKLTILATLGFHTSLFLDEVQVRGISGVSKEDMEYGRSFGYELKLLAIANRDGEEIELSVQPTFIHKSHQLAHVNDVYNAVYVYGEAVGETMFYGPGAGELPTATAIASDLVTVVKNLKLGVNGRGIVAPYRPKKLKPKERIFYRYFVRLIVKDQPGVLAHITQSLADLEISISQIFQKTLEGDQAEIVLITHQASLKSLENWLTEMDENQYLEEMVSYYAVEGGEEE